MPVHPQATERSRPLRRFNVNLEKTLADYVGMASAAGVGLLALAQPADAKIVFTPTSQNITDTGTLKIDLNADGISDFTINGAYTTTFARVHNTGGPFPSDGFVSVRGSQSLDQVEFITSARRNVSYAQALVKGAKIGSSDVFTRYGASMAYCRGSGGNISAKYGPWFHATSRFLGLKFDINGQTHYGWARLTVRLVTKDVGCQFKTVLSGYAYETVPNKPITAGQTQGPLDAADIATPPAKQLTLGALAAGAPSLTAWRKEEEPNTSRVG